MLKRVLIVLALALVPASALADAAGVRDRIVALLEADGYGDIRESRTLLGRMRFVAERTNAEREIVVNPSTGVILRDYVRLLKRGGDGDDGKGDDDDDDDDDDNSGSGSSNSGKGSDDDDDDNSGSGSSNSGGGSDDD